jgi:hypothetical protein
MACSQPRTLPFGLDGGCGKAWERCQLPFMEVRVVGGSGRSGVVVVDDGGAELAITCHGECDNQPVDSD